MTLVNTIKNFLGNRPPFQGLPSQELERLATTAQELKHRKGEAVYSEGEEAHYVWVLFSGRLEVYKYTSDGKPRAIESIQPGDLYGTLCRLGSQGKTYPCTAIASIDSISFQISDGLFLSLFQKYPSMVTGVCSLCSNRLNMMQELTCTSQEPVEKRIIRTLFQLQKNHGNILPFTKKQIGELSATTVETTIRTLSKFQKKKWISSTRGQINLLDVKQLNQLIEN